MVHNLFLAGIQDPSTTPGPSLEAEHLKEKLPLRAANTVVTMVHLQPRDNLLEHKVVDGVDSIDKGHLAAC